MKKGLIILSLINPIILGPLIIGCTRTQLSSETNDKTKQKEKEIKDNNDSKDNSSQGDTSNLDKNNSKNPGSKDNFQPNYNSSGTNSHNSNTNERENLPNDEGYKEPKKDDFETSKINQWNKSIKSDIKVILDKPNNQQELKVLVEQLISNKLELSLSNKIDKQAKEFAQKVDDLVKNEKFSDIKKMLIDYFNMVIKKVKESEKNKKQTNLEIYKSLPEDKIKELKQPISSLLKELFRENLILDLEENNKKEIEKFVQEIETLINKKQKNQIQTKLFDLVDQITKLEEALKNISI
ncbi:hypothetical protein V2P22_02430 [Mycoplasma capricolum subsp. capricolum]|uniref:Lipoprotein n=1 Tax=Mycoplasma capricolum subsp. capricolum 14232 TaxID=1188238 RepID=A0A084EM25_MYCCA|nr:hypothetical protein [Mycoplasma capricolum]KEZ19017.1 Hypothetical protein, predicted lipoprotein [Mycoplasma capricolum subsp. capricolum 14232]